MTTHVSVQSLFCHPCCSRTRGVGRCIALALFLTMVPTSLIASDSSPNSDTSISAQFRELRALEWLLHSTSDPPPCRDLSCDPNFRQVDAQNLAPPASAGTINSLEYFVTENAVACVAQSLTQKGTWTRIYQDSQNCGSFSRYQWIKGGRPSRPWATESWILRDGYLRIMAELHLNESTGAITRYRAYRDYGGGYWPPPKGVRGLKHLLPNGVAYWPVPAYIEEFWTTGNGNPACSNTQHTEATGSVTGGSGTHLGTWNAWLQDRRAVSQDTTVWHPVDVVVRAETWGGANTEYYYYGRWFDPVSQSWKGLGNVRWVWTQSGVIKGQNESHYLVDCPGVVVTCTTCPP